MKFPLRRLCLLLLLLASGCGQQQQTGQMATETSAPLVTSTAAEVSTSTSTRPTAEFVPIPTLTPEPEKSVVASAASVPTAGPGEYQNPVLKTNFADPHVLKVADTYYAYATNGSGKNIQVARSEDLVRWQVLTDAMPSLPSWARLGGSLVWAPEVLAVNDRYVLYYTARDKQSNKQCIGVATSDKPEGKFKDTNTAPLVCQAAEGGTIDASPFQDGDKLYLYFKNDGNCCSITTYLYVQEMAADGLSLVGEPTRLVRNDEFWEGRVVEAPTMVKHDDKYYLFYSGNDYAGLPYAVGYATCETAVGPCQDAPENPILASRVDPKPLVIGPGHQHVMQIEDQTWMIYHAWDVTSGGLRGSNRYMWIDRVEWKDGKPDVIGPTSDPQPVP